MFEKPSLALVPQNFTAEEIVNSPKKSVLAMVVLAVGVSLILFVGFLLVQNFTTANKIVDQVETTNGSSEETKTASDDTRIQDLNLLKSVLANYYSKNGYYPANLNSLSPEFIVRLPTDPKTGANYRYQASVDQNSFVLSARLESGREFSISSD